MTMAQSSKRREMDLMRLIMSDFKVEMNNDDMEEFYVHFHGPSNSPYEGGLWRVRVGLPVNYPYRCPSIDFVNIIYHPNVDEMSGSVCLDVIGSKWSPIFDLLNVFEVFIPQLLMYPNADDPLNGEAAALLLRDRAAYDKRVKDYCEKYAKPEDIKTGDEELEENLNGEDTSGEDDDDDASEMECQSDL